MASWYSVADNGGTQTASGKPYNEHEATCAHKTAKFGTVFLVTNKTNGKTTTCTVTDRGPYIKGRVIDLSRVGATELDMVHSGVAPVELAVVPDPFVGVVDRPLPPAVIEMQPKQSHSKASPRRGKSVQQNRPSKSRLRSPRLATKPLDAWQETKRNLRST